MMVQTFTAWASKNVTSSGTSPKLRPAVNRDRLPCKAEDRRNEHEPIVTRRDGLAICLSLLGLLGAESAKARSDPYYEELTRQRALTEGLDSSDLLSKYQKTQSGEAKKGKASPYKKRMLNKNSTALKQKKNAISAKKATTNSPVKTGTSSTAVFNPVEIGLGLAGVAGVVAIGQSSSKVYRSDRTPQRSQSKVPPSRKKPAPKPSPKKAPKVPLAGTIKRSTGTKRINSDRKKVGTVQKVERKGFEGKERSSPSSLPALLVGLVALVGVGSLLGSRPNVKEISLSSTPEAEKIDQNVAEPVLSSPSRISSSEVTLSGKTSNLAPQISFEEKAPKLPPTTGNSPLVIIGGSIMSLIVAAAVGGGSDGTGGVSKPSSSQAAADDTAARAKEAKEWIAAWKAKQK